MRRMLWLALLISALAVAGCASLSVPTPPAGGGTAPAATATAVEASPDVTPGAVQATAPVASAPEATLPATSAPEAPAPTATEAAPSGAPAATLPAIQPTPAATAGSAATFTSARLGISFNYQTSIDGQKIGVLEQGDRVYIFAGNLPPTEGQWVQVYQKPAAQSLADAIKAQVLKGYSLQDCLVKNIQNPEANQQWPATYSFAQITVPGAGSKDLGALQAEAAKCPQPYAAIGGLAYFVADSAYPDRFAFFSIGQYWIPASAGRPWQATLRFIGSGAPASATPQPAPAATGTPSGAPYVDNRSSPQAVLTSYFNAINHYEYARAYGYWNVAAGQGNRLPPFAQFRQGYADTKSVALTLGTIKSDVGAGQLYYWAPAALVAQTNSGATQTFVGCYKLHLPRPSFQAVPPFMPLAIESASVKQVANGADTRSLMAAACEPGGRPVGAGPTPAPGDISTDRYLDDRSDGVQVLRSLFNAINSKEYVRAYSYWEPDATQRPPFDPFQAGYANTASVDLVTGPTRPGAAAGNIYYQVPAVLIATNTDGSKQTFAGCYTLHMANPGMQMDPPFVPLGIRSASVRQVANNTDTQPLLQSACSG